MGFDVYLLLRQLLVFFLSHLVALLQAALFPVSFALHVKSRKGTIGIGY